MRNKITHKALIVTVCCLAAFGAAYAYVAKTAEDVCKAADQRPPAVESIGGDMLWESLSRQFTYTLQ